MKADIRGKGGMGITDKRRTRESERNDDGGKDRGIKGSERTEINRNNR